MTLLQLGFQQKRIAALFDVNQGRISEIAAKMKDGEPGSRVRVEG